MRLELLPAAPAVRLLVATGLAVGLASPVWPISAYAQNNGTTPATHRKIRTVRIVQATAMAAPAPAVLMASHGREASMEDAFSRNSEDCNHALCIGQ